MFGWLRKHFEGVVTPMRSLPKPTREAPPMPKCKSSKDSISEPIITLLEMLERDEWEVTWIDSGMYTETYLITNVYKEEVRFHLNSSCMSNTQNIYEGSWMTTEEKAMVIKALDEVVKGINKIRAAQQIIYDRKAFAKLINVEVV